MRGVNDAELRNSVIERLLETAGDARCDDHFAIDKWEWPQGVALYGLFLAAEETGEASYLDFVRDWFERHLALPIPVRNVNTSAPLLALACLAEKDGNEKYRRFCADWAQWIMTEMPRTEERGLQHVTSDLVNEGELWSDTLFMTVLFLAKTGVLLDRKDYVEEATYQFLLHIKYLCRREDGLWFHGWTFKDRGHFGGIAWARGNAWFTAGAVEFLEISKVSGAPRAMIVEALNAQHRALIALQDPSGLWHTILDDDSSYLETSASAAVAFGMLKAARLGIADEAAREAALRAVRGVTAKIGTDGVVGGVSYGTAVGMNADHYRRIPQRSTAYGQGLTFLMLTEASRA